MPVINKIREELKNEIIGIMLLAISLLIMLSVFNPSVGLAGKFINSLFMKLAGEGRFIIPLLLAITGIKLVLRKGKVNIHFNLYGGIIIAGVALTLLHFSVPRDYILKGGFDGDGGGIIGGIIYYLLLNFFGVFGMYILLTAFLLVGILLLTNQSLAVIFKRLFQKVVKCLKKTVYSVDSFVFTESEGEKDDQTVIIDRCDFEIGARGSQDQVQMADGDNEGYTEVEQIPKSNKAKVIIYRSHQCESAQAKGWPGEMETMEVFGGPDYGTSDSSGKDRINDYKLPPHSILTKPARGRISKDNRDIAENVKKLEDTLNSFGVKAKVTQVSRGPAITRYEIQPPYGVKVSRILGLADDIALSMASPDVRIEAPIPGKAVVGIEVPNKEIATVFLRELVETAEFRKMPSHLTIALGKDIAGIPIVDNLARMPHLLIAGATGAGKSVCLNTLLAGILFKSTPRQVKFLIIDPKMVELSVFNGIPHLVSPVVTDPKKAATSLRWAVKEMEYRYELFADAGVRDIVRYNTLMLEKGNQPLPLLLVIIDELADLMMVAPADVEDAICRLAQMARASGIHLIVATQRPSVDIITGLIKANIPSRISFSVSSQIDSRTILDMGGAEKLLGRGDMLYYPVGATKPIRVQGAYLSDREVELLVQHWKRQAVPKYDENLGREVREAKKDMGNNEDEMLPHAVKIFIEAGHASISLLQRRLHVGYARAARLIDIMEKKGYIGGYEGSKPRAVLITTEEFNNIFNTYVEPQAGNDK